MDYPFKTDGCSGGMSWAWRVVVKRPPPWEGCCVRHDVRYWAGGTRDEKAVADRTLRIEVAKSGHAVIALFMWAAVRVGGVPWRPTGYRWGYGWRFTRFRLYRPLSRVDAARRDRILAIHALDMRAPI